MKRRLLFISLAVVLVAGILVPTVVLAGSGGNSKWASFGATGDITGITPGTVFPAGESGRYVVVEREILGKLYGDIGGTEGADFTFTYKANVELETQAGKFHGTLDAGEYVLKVNGTFDPLDPYAPTPSFTTLTEDWYILAPDGSVIVLPAGTPYPAGYPMPKLTFSGHWTFIDGANGQGDIVDAWAQFTTDPYGHVNAVYFSDLTMTGKYKVD